MRCIDCRYRYDCKEVSNDLTGFASCAKRAQLEKIESITNEAQLESFYLIEQYKHRAEVAERALQLLGEEYYNEFDLDDCEYTPKNIEEFIKRYIVKAEKELEEGR